MDRRKRFRSLALHPHPRRGSRSRVFARRRKSARPWTDQAPGRGPRIASARGWQKAGVVALFALMASVGFGAYAGYGRMVCTSDEQALARHSHRPPPLAPWVHSFPPAPTDAMPDEMGA